MDTPATTLFSATAAEAGSVLPPLQWGWLALVAGVHLAGIAWLGMGEPAQKTANANDRVLSVQLLTAPPTAAPTAAAAAAAQRPPQPLRAQLPPPAEPRQRQPLKPPQHAKSPTAAAAPSKQDTAPPPVLPVPSLAPPAPAHPAPAAVPPISTAAPADLAQTVSSPAPAAHTDVGAAPTQPAFQPARYDAAYLHNPEPAYPATSRRRGEQGEVILRVRVLANGQAADVEIAHSSKHPRLDQAALRAVIDWRFEPARQGETAVDSWLRVPVVFRLQPA